MPQYYVMVSGPEWLEGTVGFMRLGSLRVFPKVAALWFEVFGFSGLPKGPKVVPFGGSYFSIYEPQKEQLWGLWVVIEVIRAGCVPRIYGLQGLCLRIQASF